MSIIASASNHLNFHHWFDGSLRQTYIPAEHHEEHIKSISWGKDGAWIVLVPHFGPAEIVSIKDNVKLLQKIQEVQYPTCATFQNGTKKNIALGTTCGEVLVYDVKSRNIKKRFPRTYTRINQLQYNAKDSHLAAACASGGIFVYNTMTTNLSSCYRMPTSNSVSSITFHRSKRNLFGGGDEGGMIAIWDINKNSPLFEKQAHNAPTTSLVFSPLRSDMLVTSGLDRRFTFYDILTKKCIVEIEVTSSVTALDFSYCGTYLGVGSQSGVVILYDTRNLNKAVHAFPAHEGRNICHLLFQKVLDGQDNSTLDIVEISSICNDVQKEECNNQSVESLSIATTCDECVSECDKKVSQETQDSFLAALGFDNSSVAEVNKVSGISSGPMSVEKWMDETKRFSLPPAKQRKGLLHASFCISKHLQNDLHSTEMSPIVGASLGAPSRKNTSVSINSTPIENSHSNQMNLCSGELKDSLREVIKEEFALQLELYENKVTAEFNDHYDNLNRRILDVQMSIVKTFAGVEAILENVKNALDTIKINMTDMKKEINRSKFEYL